MRHVDTLLKINILNYLQNHCGEKTVKIGTILSGKSSKDPSWLAMCNVYIRNELPTRLPVHLNAIQCKGDILPIQACGDFYVSFVYWYCHEQSTCRIVPWIFRQSIISTIDNSTIANTNILWRKVKAPGHPHSQAACLCQNRVVCTRGAP